jgi:hypothetical protein
MVVRGKHDVPICFHDWRASRNGKRGCVEREDHLWNAWCESCLCVGTWACIRCMGIPMRVSHIILLCRLVSWHIEDPKFKKCAVHVVCV